MADQKPRLELKTSETIELLPKSVPAVMVDVLAGEVVPSQLKALWLEDGKAEVDRDVEGQCFRIQGHPLGERLLAMLLAQQGSDLHCSTHEPPLVRIHGDLQGMEGIGPLIQPPCWR